MATAAPRANKVTEEKEWRGLVKLLATAVSTQAQVANRTWLALITVAIIALIPRKDGDVSLPFNFGNVPLNWFYPAVLCFLIVLTIAFATAHAQQFRAQKLAQRVIDEIEINLTGNEKLHPRDLFDMLRVPSLNRVASLVQTLGGRSQFYVDRRGLAWWRRLIIGFYYLLIKLLSSAIYSGLPMLALVFAYQRVLASSLPRWCYMLGFLAGLFAFCVLLHVFYLDLSYIAARLYDLWKPKQTVKS